MSRQVPTYMRAGKAAVLVLCLVCVCTAVVHAEDNTTNIISGTTNNIAGSYYVGSGGTNNYLEINSGGCLGDAQGIIGSNSFANFNTALVTGSGSVWSNSSGMAIGLRGVGNQLTVSNGGHVQNSFVYIGYMTGSSNNAVLVTGAGSLWSNSSDLCIGLYGEANRLTLSDGAVVQNSSGQIGYWSGSNVVLVIGTGSVWSNSASLYVGYYGSSNQLRIAAGATVVANGAWIGYNASSSNNVVTVLGGNLMVTNTDASGLLTIQRGSLALSNGTVFADKLVATNGTRSIVNFQSGTLSISSSIISNGQQFAFGTGADTATLQLRGGTNSFAKGLLISSSNAVLTGTGTIAGNVVVNGTVQADVGNGLIFLNAVTNNAVLRAANGAVLESWGPVVNNGVIDVIYGNTNFHSTFINNGIVLTAEGDPDGDGMSNLHESLAGTIVTNSSSCLRVTGVAREGDDVRITWTAVGGKSYMVQTNSTPSSGFADFSPAISVPGVGESVTNYLHAGGATNSSALFYRVRLGP